MRVYPPSTLEKTRINSVEHRQSMQGAKHDYILLTVDNGPHIRYVRIDRRPSKRIDNRIRLFLGNAVVANDTISMSATPFDSARSYSLYTMNFDTNQLRANMHDLITILTILPCLASRYHLYSSCCYWFSRMVFESLARITQGRVIVSADRPQYRPHPVLPLRLVRAPARQLLKKNKMILTKKPLMPPARESFSHHVRNGSASIMRVSRGNLDDLTIESGQTPSTQHFPHDTVGGSWIEVSFNQ